jgi:hypothetical protein
MDFWERPLLPFPRWQVSLKSQLPNLKLFQMKIRRTIQGVKTTLITYSTTLFPQEYKYHKKW